MKYNCVECKYSTDDRCNWDRHTKSKKHLKNVENEENLKKENDDTNLKIRSMSTQCQPNVNPTSTQCQPDFNSISIQSSINDKHNSNHSFHDISKFVCPNCNDHFTTRQALSRHKKNSCSQKNDDLVTSLKKQNEELKKRNEELENDKDYLKKTTTEVISVAKYSTAALKFLDQSYPNAPPLEAMPNYLAIKNDCGKKELALVLSEFYKEGKVVKYLGQFYLDHYKKLKLEEQSFWSSDISRLSCIIKKIVDNKAIWVTDKQGIETKKTIIKPATDYIEKELYEFMRNSENHKYPSLIESCASLVLDIQSSVIGDNLLKFLAPHFQIPSYKAPLAIK